jgi:RNA polymerase-binding transcription factor
MDRKTIQRFKKLLQARDRGLRAGMAQADLNNPVAQQDYGKDEGDRANTSVAREIHVGQKSRERAILNAVNSAMLRVSDGTFGQCLNCGQDIDLKRLEALPWAQYCITCQELIDATRK